jgi:1,4-alpha-glucan branching enzyme
MISQADISANTPMGANLVPGGGATFRAWAPLATAVYINGTFGGSSLTGQTENLLMAKNANGYWTGFVDSAQEGDGYTFRVVGPGGTGPKRDPYARELAPATAFPNCSNLIRSATAYPWHDGAFVTPDFSNMTAARLPAVSGESNTLSFSCYTRGRHGSSSKPSLDLCNPLPFSKSWLLVCGD